MRRNSIVIMAALLLVGAVFAYADEAVLIDFDLLKADILPKTDAAGNQIKDATGNPIFQQDRDTMMDFSVGAGASYSAVQKKQMMTSLAIPNWDIALASSARNNLNQALSMTAEAFVQGNRAKDDYLKDKTVMGIRVHFPVEEFNSWAMITPPFEIPAFEPKADIADDGTIKNKEKLEENEIGYTRFEGKKENDVIKAFGIVKNVGVVKSIAVRVKGLNFPHGLSIILKDADGNEKTMFMGYLNFDGWRELRWDNPQYIGEVRNRELRVYPLYPKTTPMVKFGGFLVNRDAASAGGDFVTYVKEVRILYDKAVLDPIRDIDDEGIWGIVTKKEKERQTIESKHFGDQQVLRYLEKSKQTGDWVADQEAAKKAGE